jgi:3-methyladenine DNA glycosylase/8-oxoguanine DNA glycosylase
MSSSFRKRFCVEFQAIPPYSFALSVHKPAGWWWSTPTEVFGDDMLWTTARLDTRLYGLRLEATGASRKPAVSCTVYADKTVSEAEKDYVSRTVERALGVNEDMNEFYEVARKDNILRQTVEDLCGMRTVAWPELFPALILAVTLQMAPMKRSNQMMDLLIENFGEHVRFDGKTIAHWPSPTKIANLTVGELKEKAKLGYRALNLKCIAETLLKGFPSSEQLAAMPSDEAKKQLMTLRGIGDYSAEIVMPGMRFPLDVWSAKIFSVLFYQKVPDQPRDAIAELKKVTQERWGRWTGHAFVYVLNDLPNISKRIGSDLTRF